MPPSVFSCWDLLEKTISEPKSLFETLRNHWDESYFWVGLSLVAGISSIDPIINTAGQGVATALAAGLSGAIAGIICWVFVGVLLSMAAYAFTRRSQGKLFLTLSALATVPWLLSAPLLLLKQTDVSGLATLASIGQLGLWGWTVGLFILAFSVAYQLSWERVTLLLLMPLLLFIVFTGWLVGFFVNLFHFIA